VEPDDSVSLSLYLDDATEAFATYRPPASVTLDTATLADGPHVLRIHARDGAGKDGVREIPFVVQNGPGITVTGLRSGERVSGRLELDVNAFGGGEPFDPVRAESSAPIPVWTWVMITLIAAWSGWYGLTEFQPPASFAAANAPLAQTSPVRFSGRGTAAGFDYAATGPQLYATNCAACHGATGAGVPGAFPALAGDPVVTATDPRAHLTIVLHGLSGKAIGGTPFSGQMPSFPQLSDAEIAAIVDHERTSWGNAAPIVTPNDVKRAR
jgi:mono/diheme cytochrome c family protein